MNRTAAVKRMTIEETTWDNSNIADSFPGATTPLTFTFARRIYGKVYLNFLETMGARGLEDCKEQDDLLGFIRGRIYCDVGAWRRLFSKIPGFRWSRGILDDMMGFKEIAQPEEPFSIPEFVALSQNAALMTRRFFEARRFTKSFNDRFETIIKADDYFTLEREFASFWDVPIINDSLALLLYSVLRKLCGRWLGDESILNDLLCEGGGIKNSESPVLIQKMAESASSDPKFVERLRNSGREQILSELQSHPDFKLIFDAYMEGFGDRCAGDLRLEIPTPAENPLPLFRAVGEMALHPNFSRHESKEIREWAEDRVRQALDPVRGVLFDWLLKNIRDRIRDRENFRFARTRIFARFRSIFLATGGNDVFFLEIDEVLDAMAGGRIDCEIIAKRKSDYEKFLSLPPLPNRFTMPSGSIQADVRQPNRDSPVRNGIGASPGKVRGEVQVVTEPSRARVIAGRILVCEHTDPNWITVFPSASGILVERGSVLSHAATVAREMAIPAVVSVDGLTHWLRDGDTVEFDGATGRIEKV